MTDGQSEIFDIEPVQQPERVAVVTISTLKNWAQELMHARGDLYAGDTPEGHLRLFEIISAIEEVIEKC